MKRRGRRPFGRPDSSCGRGAVVALAGFAACAVLALTAPGAVAAAPGSEDTAFGSQGAAFGPASIPNPPVFAEQDADGSIFVASQAKELDGESTVYPVRYARFSPTGESLPIGGASFIPPGSSALRDMRIVHGGQKDGYVVFPIETGDGGSYQYIRGDGNASGGSGPLIDAGNCATPSLAAARVEASGAVIAVFNGCPGTKVVRFDIDFDTFDAARTVTALGDELGDARDIELGPDGQVYVLGQDPEEDGSSAVVRLSGATLAVDGTYGTGGRTTLDGQPVDLAVDPTGRAYAWTDSTSTAGAMEPWDIYRLTADGDPDIDWGDEDAVIPGRVRLTSSELRDPSASQPAKMILTPDGKLLVEGRNTDNSVILARLTDSGVVDTSWGSGGFKELGFVVDSDFFEPTTQSDGKVLVPFAEPRSGTVRSFGTPPEGGRFGVGRLFGGSGAGASGGPGGGTTSGSGSQSSSNAPGTVCGRRAISLVRAFSRGRRVRLDGLVGSAFYGKKVAIYARSGGRSRKVKTVRATRIGTFKASVRRPRGRRFVTARYFAKAGSKKSALLKLPQSLKSTSIKKSGDEITIRGRVKRALVGDRRRVKIQRLVCGHYKTVGSSRPSASGHYSLTFEAPRLGGVAYYRARGVVLNKPGGRRHVVQYARAVRIRLSAQTG